MSVSPDQVSLSVSVALCTYNGQQFLREQLDSIQRQTRLPDELVVCDDRSSDATQEIVEAFARGASFPVRWHVNEVNLGSTLNFERAIGLCQGDLVFLSDQDDAWHPRKIELMTREFEFAPEVGLVFSDAEVVDAGLHPLGYRLWDSMEFSRREQRLLTNGRALDVLLKHNVVTGAALAFRRNLCDEFLPLPSSWIHDGWIAIIVSMCAEVRVLSEPLLSYRQHGRNQVGGVKRNLQGQAAHAGTIGAAHYRQMAEQYAAVHEWVRAKGGGASGQAHTQSLAGKIAHLLHRAGLPRAWPGRAWLVGWALVRGDYHRYSRGWRSAVKDFLRPA
ncbi:glycosyltransferase family 2 protein [Uliginosibacterium sp. H1]|uniref:glycosyltransferase family 2 protein n=1 Tax=Uliginosibacterium sp. H1 TaxID=3114757 RepID=UPI002E19F5C1|nr:glycosyltransferase family 2 protein [Uliginosibacterium sp. H1]